MTDQKALKKYADSIAKGAVVLFPTDTVVGLGCRFDSEEGIIRVRAVKGIKESSPLAVLISSEDQIDHLKMRRSRLSNQLIKEFWPGGLTIVLSSEVRYPCSGLGNTLGLRMPDADLLRKIIEMVGVPLVATSANLHGGSPACAMEEVDESIVEMVDDVINLPIRGAGFPSTVIKIVSGEVRIIREGATSSKEIYAVAREVF